MSHLKFRVAVVVALGMSVSVYLATRNVEGADAPVAPATVSGHVAEADLQTIKLTPDADRRLGIETVAIERRPMPRSRLYGGEIVLPPRAPGAEVGVAYPVGTPASAYQFADARIAAEARERQAVARTEGARVALERAERMLMDESGSQRAVEEARTALAVAEADHGAATAQIELLRRSTRNAVPGKVWVRTAVFGSDLAGLNVTGSARVGALGEADPARYRTATPVRAPHSADPVAGTTDLYFELASDAGALLPGQRVSVLVPLTGAADTLTVPWAAVVHDINGGAWVYERVGERTYSRRPIQVRFVNDGIAALQSGPAVGALVVTAGAAELFGTEFGVGH